MFHKDHFENGARGVLSRQRLDKVQLDLIRIKLETINKL